jgi:hypothetical protein
VLQRRLSPERLAPYVRAAGTVPAALRLHRWNTAVSAALFEDLANVEVVLRNALDERLQAWHVARHGSGDWWDDPDRVLEPQRHEDVAIAKARLTKPATHGRILAELNFGFWRFLLSRRYEATLWTPILRHAFPRLTPPRRGEIGDRLQRLNRLRNRIAHHEPVHALVLQSLHEDCLFVAAAICDVTEDWVRRTSRVQATLAIRP